MTKDILGYSVSGLSAARLADEIAQHLLASTNPGRAPWLACINPHSYAIAKKDELFSSALKRADWLIPDGVGIVLASMILRNRVAERVTGFDVFEHLLSRLNTAGGYSVFFLGSTDKTLGMIRARMREVYPNVRVAGVLSPPFKGTHTPSEVGAMIDTINAAKPDVLWVGMTAPKQEKWIHDNIDKLDIRFAAAVGAVFDFFAGTVKRSHPIFRDMGLEWLPRLVQQPRRLWPRMFVSAPVFMHDVHALAWRRLLNRQPP